MYIDTKSNVNKGSRERNCEILGKYILCIASFSFLKY